MRHRPAAFVRLTPLAFAFAASAAHAQDAQEPASAPPPALISAYKAKAQMLGPLFAKDGYLSGWISVHYIGRTYPLSEADSRAMDGARDEVKRLTGIGS